MSNKRFSNNNNNNNDRLGICGSCLYYVPTEVGVGECHLNPPTVYPVVVQTPLGTKAGRQSSFSIVQSSNQGCSHYVAKPVGDNSNDG